MSYNNRICDNILKKSTIKNVVNIYNRDVEVRENL